MKKWTLILMWVFLLSGCISGGVRPFTNLSSLWGSPPEKVTVQKGDTLYSISKRYNIQLRDLVEANNLRPPYTLSIGQTLRIPIGRYHIVAKGDTLYSISRRYNADVTTLSRLNNIRPPYTLSIGQKLAISASVGSTSVKSTPSSSSSSSGESQRWVPPKASPSRQGSKVVSVKRQSKFVWPVKGAVISPFGNIAKGRSNDGINIKANSGDTVKAADAGTIAYAGNELKGFGNLILIRHNDGWITAYAHLDRLMVKKGQKVVRGEKIGTVGTTGGVSTPQLHFEIRAGKKSVNPVNYLE